MSISAYFAVRVGVLCTRHHSYVMPSILAHTFVVHAYRWMDTDNNNDMNPRLQPKNERKSIRIFFFFVCFSVREPNAEKKKKITMYQLRSFFLFSLIFFISVFLFSAFCFCATACASALMYSLAHY